MKRIVKILLWIWQAPQNIVGLVFRIIYGPVNGLFRGVPIIVYDGFPGGISLGRTIIVRRCDFDSLKHEYGHTVQSRYLGPLYLFIVGIPSLLWAAWYRKHKRGSYYAFYTEKWADKLGGVDRSEK